MVRRVISQEIIDKIIDGYEGLPYPDDEDMKGLLEQDMIAFPRKGDPRCSLRPLTRFSLVARNWLPRSRHHLFKAPIVQITQAQYKSLGALVDSAQEKLGSIGPFIHHLRISDPCPFIFLPIHLPVLDKLTLEGTLTLRQVMTLMLHIPTLRSVQFNWVKLGIPAKEPKIGKEKYPSIDSLHTIDIMGGTSLLAISWMTKLTPSHQISTLNIRRLFLDEMGMLAQFLTSIAASLQYLVMTGFQGFALGDCETEFANTVNLGRLKQLRSLMLPAVSLLPPKSVNALGVNGVHAVDFLIVVLKTLPSSSKLEGLTISAANGDLADFPWGELDDTLKRKSFAMLKDFYFDDWTVKDLLKVPEAETLITQHLPKVATRGILRIRFNNLNA